MPAWAVASVAVVALVVGIGVVATGGDDGDDTLASVTTTATGDTSTADTTGDTTATAPSSTDDTDDTTAGESTVPDTSDDTDDTVAEPSGDEVDGAPPGQRGTRESPVAAGGIADIGGGWRLQVTGVMPDAADFIIGENEFNDPPPAGSQFTIVTVALGYFGREDPNTTLEPTIAAVGSANVELDSDCGLIPDQLPYFLDVFAGGVVTGNLCFVTTPADLDGLQLYATGDYFSDDGEVFLEAVQPAGANPMPALTGPQAGAISTPARMDPIALGTTTDVGEGWSLTITGAARDITAEVQTENSFNDPPPAGFTFVGVDVSYVFNGSGSDAPYTVTTAAVDDGNVQLSTECGLIPNPVDSYSDVFSGGTVSGLLCFVVPTDSTGLTIYARTGFEMEVPFVFAVS